MAKGGNTNSGNAKVSVNYGIDLLNLVNEKAENDGVSFAESIRCILRDYFTKFSRDSEASPGLDEVIQGDYVAARPVNNIHPANKMLPQSYVTHADPNIVASVCNELLNELDACRYNNYQTPIEERVARLELLVLTLATAVKNKTI